MWNTTVPKTMCKHLEEDLSRHGEAVGNYGLFIWRFALPAVQLQTAAAGQQTLAVHLRRRHARELTSCKEIHRKTQKNLPDVQRDNSWANIKVAYVTCQVRVVGGLDEVVG